jgi:hypothetical protein
MYDDSQSAIESDIILAVRMNPYDEVLCLDND